VTFTGEERIAAVTPLEQTVFKIEVERKRPDEAEADDVSIELEWPESADDERPTVVTDTILVMNRRRWQPPTSKSKQLRAAVASTCIGIGERVVLAARPSQQQQYCHKWERVLLAPER
jgi:hypothetical protein